jgi:osmoprotectant transport system ATP-binding protein
MSSNGHHSKGATEMAIRLDGVDKVFPGTERPAVSALSLEIPRGATVALIGPSGCGKTTTLRMINGLIAPTAGRIEVDGTDIATQPTVQLRRGIGYVIQEVGLFPHRTIAQNIGTVPKMLGWERDRIAERIDELVDLVGLDRDMLRRYPDELSGGQQQRVGVARALAADPPVLLMDEPFGAVDPIVRTRLQDELIALQSRVQKTIVLVTHDLDEALKLADHIALLNVGGILEQYASPDDLLRAPANEFVERFIGDDRSLRRLALARVEELPFERGPVVEHSASLVDVKDAIESSPSEWFGLTRDGRFLGWVDGSNLNGGSVDALPREPPAAQVRPDSTLREAMEVIVTSATAVAVIDDDGRFGGVVTLDQIRDRLGSTALR